MQPTYLFNRNKKRTLVAYTCKKDTKCHKYFQIADISAAVFLASECIMLLMSVATNSSHISKVESFPKVDQPASRKAD